MEDGANVRLNAVPGFESERGKLACFLGMVGKDAIPTIELSKSLAPCQNANLNCPPSPLFVNGMNLLNGVNALKVAGQGFKPGPKL